MVAGAGLKLADFLVTQGLRVLGWAMDRSARKAEPEAEEPARGLTHQDVRHQQDQIRRSTTRLPPKP